jgi:hypothetical protein
MTIGARLAGAPEELPIYVYRCWRSTTRRLISATWCAGGRVPDRAAESEAT